MPKDISISAYFESYSHLPLIDVRSPGEFAKGHIPGATNIPLFSDEERAHVGTVYVQESREKAMELGYKYVTPKLQSFITESRKVAPQNQVTIYCWRGGMRSHAFGGHLKENGFDNVYIIKKGYKAYRTLAVSDYEEGFLHVLGGFTGSGKTHILNELKNKNHQVIDLEGLANHKGSAFGRIGMGEQPTTEQFANNLYWEWRQLNFKRPVWVEDENLSIGSVNIPLPLFNRIRESKLIFINIKREERAKLLVKDYVIGDVEKLIDSIKRISKRLGPQNTIAAIENVQQNNFYEAAMLILTYYDKYYAKGMKKREEEKIQLIPLPDTNSKDNAEKIVSAVESFSLHEKTK